MTRALPAGKSIVVTGATSGIGRELLNILAPNNNLTVIGRSSERLKFCAADHPDIKIVECDLSDVSSIRKAGETIRDGNGQVDILINNAATQYTPLLTDESFDPGAIPQEININLSAPAMLTQLLMPNLMQSDHAIVMNINSGLALVPKTSSAVYCATKGGLNILTQALRNQFDGTGIEVKQVFLPLVDTGMTQGRGSGKLTARDAAERIVAALSGKRLDIDVGKVKILRLLSAFFPPLARRIMRKA